MEQVARLVALLVAMAGCAPSAPRPAAPSPHARLSTARDPLAAAAIMADVAWLVDPVRAGRGSFQPGGVVAADYMAQQLEAAGLTVVRQRVEGEVDNVIGILRGGRSAIVVSAHYDHLGVSEAGVLYPGADDNASGAAVLLALARYAAGRRYRDTILFIAFGAEEPGLIGSRAYLESPAWPLEDTRAVVNFDMVGRNFFEAISGREAAAAVIGLEDDAGARAATHAAAAAAGLALIETPARFLEVFGSDFRTDDWWFRRNGILAIHFSTGMHDDYHQPSDTIDRLVPAQLERVARTAAGLLEYLAGGGG